MEITYTVYDRRGNILFKTTNPSEVFEFAWSVLTDERAGKEAGGTWMRCFARLAGSGKRAIDVKFRSVSSNTEGEDEQHA